MLGPQITCRFQQKALISQWVRLFNIVSSSRDNANGQSLPYSKHIASSSTSAVEQSIPTDDAKVATVTSEQLQVIKLELQANYEYGQKVPEPNTVTEQQWNQALTLPSKRARRMFFLDLMQRRTLAEERKVKKEKRRIEGAQKREQVLLQREQNDHLIYGLGKNSLLFRINPITESKWQNKKLHRARLVYPKLVFDCSCEDYMYEKEWKMAANQLKKSFSVNRIHRNPFDLAFYNFDPDGSMIKHLAKQIPTMFEKSHPLKIYKNCFSEAFSRDRLVYLTPHCLTDLEEYNPDDVYIIGAMVDTCAVSRPVSVIKAKELGIRMARFPLDRYFQGKWASGRSKRLALQDVVKIMLELKQTRSWEKALQHVPRIKIKDEATAPGQNEHVDV